MVETAIPPQSDTTRSVGTADVWLGPIGRGDVFSAVIRGFGDAMNDEVAVSLTVQDLSDGALPLAEGRAGTAVEFVLVGDRVSRVETAFC